MKVLDSNNLRIGLAGLTTNDYKKTYNTLLETCRKSNFLALEMEFLNVNKLSSYPSIAIIKKLSSIATKNQIKISVHAPYYINLASTNNQTVNFSLQHIIKSLRIAQIFQSYIVVHAGFYQQTNHRKSINKVIESLKKLNSLIEKENQIKISHLTLETPGKFSSIGTIDELIKIANIIGCSICIDWGHLYARKPSDITQRNIINIIDKIETNIDIKYWHMHISGIKRNNKGEVKHLSFRKSFFPVDIVVNTLKEIGLKGTLICESPERFKKDTYYLLKIYETGKIPFPRLKRLDDFL